MRTRFMDVQFVTAQNVKAEALICNEAHFFRGYFCFFFSFLSWLCFMFLSEFLSRSFSAELFFLLVVIEVIFN